LCRSHYNMMLETQKLGGRALKRNAKKRRLDKASEAPPQLSLNGTGSPRNVVHPAGGVQ